MYKELYKSGEILEFDYIISAYIEYILFKLFNPLYSKNGIIIFIIRAFHLLVSLFAITGWLLPPKYKALTLIYIIGLSSAIIFYFLLKKCYISIIVSIFLENEQEEQLIPISGNFLLSIWICFLFISINGYFNPDYSAFSLIKKIFNSI